MTKEILFQSLDFTCGPVCLKMAMHRLDASRPRKEVNEFLIWREANSVFMGHGHPGCTHFGLARAALKRNFTADLYSNNLDYIEDILEQDVLRNNEKTVYNMVYQYDRDAALDEGLICHREDYHPDLFRRLLSQGKVPLILVRAFIDQEGHWVLIDKIENGIVTVVDPYEKHAAHPSALGADSDALATHALPLQEFESYYLHGEARAYLLLAIGRK